MSNVTGKYVDIDGCETYYEEAGDGRAILFLAPSGRENSHWRECLKHFGPNYRCIAIDFPGHGKSSILPGDDHYLDSIEGISEFLKRFLDELKITEVCVVGCSIGGNLCFTMAALYPERVTAIVPIQGLIYSPLLKPAGLQMIAHPHVNLIHGLVDNAQSLTGPKSSKKGFDFITNTVPNVNPLALKSDLNAYCLTDFRDKADRISASVLVVRGTDDWLVDQELTDQTMDLLVNAKNVEFAPLEGLGHFPYLEDPDAFYQIVDPFLEANYAK